MKKVLILFLGFTLLFGVGWVEAFPRYVPQSAPFKSIGATPDQVAASWNEWINKYYHFKTNAYYISGASYSDDGIYRCDNFANATENWQKFELQIKTDSAGYVEWISVVTMLTPSQTASLEKYADMSSTEQNKYRKGNDQCAILTSLAESVVRQLARHDTVPLSKGSKSFDGIPPMRFHPDRVQSEDCVNNDRTGTAVWVFKRVLPSTSSGFLIWDFTLYKK